MRQPHRFSERPVIRLRSARRQGDCDAGACHVAYKLGWQVHLLQDEWLDCVPLQPRMRLRAAERAIMLGRMEGPMAVDPGSCLSAP